MKERIKLIRNHYGLTQTQFAEKLNLSQNFIAQIESGKKNMSPRTLNDVCEAFKINNDWLISGQGEMLIPPEDERAAYVSYLLENVDDPVANLIASIMKTYLECDEKDKLVLRNFVDKLVNKNE